MINLVQLNRSITDQYCVNPRCTGRSAGFSADFLLPLHPRFPRVIATIQFQYAHPLFYVTQGRF